MIEYQTSHILFIMTQVFFMVLTYHTLKVKVIIKPHIEFVALNTCEVHILCKFKFDTFILFNPRVGYDLDRRSLIEGQSHTEA